MLENFTAATEPWMNWLSLVVIVLLVAGLVLFGLRTLSEFELRLGREPTWWEVVAAVFVTTMAPAVAVAVVWFVMPQAKKENSDA